MRICVCLCVSAYVHVCDRSETDRACKWVVDEGRCFPGSVPIQWLWHRRGAGGKEGRVEGSWYPCIDRGLLVCEAVNLTSLFQSIERKSLSQRSTDLIKLTMHPPAIPLPLSACMYLCLLAFQPTCMPISLSKSRSVDLLHNLHDCLSDCLFSLCLPYIWLVTVSLAVSGSFRATVSLYLFLFGRTEIHSL